MIAKPSPTSQFGTAQAILLLLPKKQKTVSGTSTASLFPEASPRRAPHRYYRSLSRMWIFPRTIYMRGTPISLVLQAVQRARQGHLPFAAPYRVIMVIRGRVALPGRIRRTTKRWRQNHQWRHQAGGARPSSRLHTQNSTM